MRVAIQKTIGVVGAGFSGAVIAHTLAEAGYRVAVVEGRSHVAGNCHSVRDGETGVLTHVYGPHIFHTSNQKVWDYIRQFAHFRPYTNRVKAIYQGRVYSLPINLLTINSFFGKIFSPAEAQAFIAALGDATITAPQSFEAQALRFLGRDLYEAFFKGYTLKQWGLSPAELPASILKRLPVRFNYDDNYYASTYQGLPEQGYTAIVEKMLDHPHITLHLNTPFEPHHAKSYHHVFYSGCLDAWFGFDEGRLGYRTLDFQVERHAGDYQGNAVINYCDASTPWTRISEHKHFAPWETHEKTLIYKEFSRSCGESDIPYYPIRLLNDKALLGRYVARARAEKGVSFIGRLGTYRYLDMHVTIGEALETAVQFLAAEATGNPLPAFTVDPLGSA